MKTAPKYIGQSGNSCEWKECAIADLGEAVDGDTPLYRTTIVKTDVNQITPWKIKT